VGAPASQRLRVLMLINIGVEVGGAERSVKLMCDTLRSRGHEVFIMSTDLKLKGEEPFADLVIPRGPRRGWAGVVARFWYRDAYRSLKEVISNFKPDVIHAHTIGEFSPAALWATASTPTVLTVHGPETWTLELLRWMVSARAYRGHTYRWHNLKLGGLIYYLYLIGLQRPLWRLGFRYVNVFLTPSHYMAAVVRRDVGKTPVVQAYNGIAFPPLAPFRRTSNVLFVGRLEIVKGVDTLLRAMALARREVPGITLTIAGEGTDTERFKELSRTLGLEDVVDFRGWLKPSEVDECRAASEVVVIPSLWPEILGMVGIEAMAAGRPVIASNGGGIPEYVIDGVTGRLVPRHNPQALADALVEVLSDSAISEKMSEAALDHAERFRLDAFIDKVESVYYGVVD
jgi:glycosyltransferase involved in cell wall biosynthesis